jgi:lysophospholipase L1-like esterase
MNKRHAILLPALSNLLRGFRCLKLPACFAAILTGALSPALAAPGDPGDPNIKYVGRWDFSNGSEYSSYWGGSYIKVKFTGTTVKIKLGNGSNYYVKIDNGSWTSYFSVSGTVNLTPTPLANGTHTLSVAQGKDYDYMFKFQGLILDSGATTSPPSVATNLIEFIGDSITTGYTDAQADVSDYAWVCAESLNSEHTQIAYPGIALVTGYGVNSDKTGMDSQYFKFQPLGYTSPPNWDFTKYTAKLVVINIGQNDGGNSDSLFQSTYTTFLSNIRAKFPNADIFVMRTFTGTKSTPTLAAVNARNAAGDAKVHYVNTSGWLAAGTSDYNDSVHPSVSGHIKAANLLKPILMPYLTPQAGSTYHLVCQKSGKALDDAGSTTDGTNIVQWTSGAGNTHQEWKLVDVGGGYYHLICQHNMKALDNRGSTTDGTTLGQWNDGGAGNTHQSWRFVDVGNGYYHLINQMSGKAMDNLNSTTDATAVGQWSDGGSANINQNWRLDFIR